ncbi:hypothetical protein V8F06_008221 [Rhypophila decipiens]
MYTSISPTVFYSLLTAGSRLILQASAIPVAFAFWTHFFHLFGELPFLVRYISTISILHPIITQGAGLVYDLSKDIITQISHILAPAGLETRQVPSRFSGLSDSVPFHVGFSVCCPNQPPFPSPATGADQSHVRRWEKEQETPYVTSRT